MMDRRTVRNICQNKFVKLVHLVGFIIKKFVTMHGNTNLKFQYTCMLVNIFYISEYCKYYGIYKPYKCTSGKDYILLHI